MDICYLESSSFSVIKIFYIKFKKREGIHTIYETVNFINLQRTHKNQEERQPKEGGKYKQVDPRQTK